MEGPNSFLRANITWRGIPTLGAIVRVSEDGRTGNAIVVEAGRVSERSGVIARKPFSGWTDLRARGVIVDPRNLNPRCVVAGARVRGRIEAGVVLRASRSQPLHFGRVRTA